MPTLGGHVWVYKGVEFDYPFIEAIESLLPVCDQVAVTMFSDEDFDLFRTEFPRDEVGHPYEEKLKVVKLIPQRFEEGKDQHRLAEWTDFTKEMLSTDWQFCLQADEVIHESSYPIIRQAIERQDAEAFIVRRFNLWGDPYHYLNYPKLIKEGRAGELPCSNHTGRLAKIKYKSHGDAESLDAPFNDDYAETIKTYHMGFVRDKRKMVQAKMVMQRDVFALGYFDPRFQHDLDHNDGKFDPYTRFSREDLLPIREPLPKVIQSWAEARI